MRSSHETRTRQYPFKNIYNQKYSKSLIASV